MELQMPDLAYRSKAILSWIVAAELLKNIDDEVFIGILYPGGDQYDCLSLVTPQEEPFIMLNRNGVNCNVRGSLVTDIWSSAAQDPKQCAAIILSELGPEYEFNVNSQRNKLLVEIAINIATYLNENYGRKASVDWAWIDASSYVGRNEIIDEFSIPDKWKLVEGPSENISWEGWLFIIKHDTQAVAVVNMQTGESLDKNGKSWDKWPKKVFTTGGERIAPLGFKFDIKWPAGNLMNLDLVHPSLWRQTNKIYSEEGCEVNSYPISNISNKDLAIAMWAMVDDAKQYKEQMKEFLD
jgi:hypothetical protein